MFRRLFELRHNHLIRKLNSSRIIAMSCLRRERCSDHVNIFFDASDWNLICIIIILRNNKTSTAEEESTSDGAVEQTFRKSKSIGDMSSHEKEGDKNSRWSQDGAACAPFSDLEAGVACCGCFRDASEHWTDFELVDNGNVVGCEFADGEHWVAEAVSMTLIGAADVFWTGVWWHMSFETLQVAIASAFFHKRI